jgi:molecular chaperone GrpE (heat shock protein)
MTEAKLGAVSKTRFYVPFVLGDLLLLAAAWLIFQNSSRPMASFAVAGMAFCVTLGAWFSVWPLVLRHRADVKLLETAALQDALAQIQNLEQLAGRIAAATGHWQTAQEHAAETVNAAREVSERMAAEKQEFMAFLEKANDAERNHLRLEVEKLRRAEADWLRVLAQVFDHIYGLYTAAVRFGQPNLTEQLGNFQNACREAARRIGFAPFTIAPGTPFDPDAHHLADPDTPAPPGACVAETLATGYTYQGQLVRPPLVSLQAAAPQPAPPPSEPTPQAPGTEAEGA